ncbi:hypothetical protein [Streptomyces luteireticuli]|uniref:hypothetical protein n=1 Tax=Streptomyces luteireticuli TaxID=173858 RepID=UPI0035566975
MISSAEIVVGAVEALVALVDGALDQAGDRVDGRVALLDGVVGGVAVGMGAVPPRRLDPAIAKAVERQTMAMRELAAKAFSEPETAPEDGPAPMEATPGQCRRQAAATAASSRSAARWTGMGGGCAAGIADIPWPVVRPGA